MLAQRIQYFLLPPMLLSVFSITVWNKLIHLNIFSRKQIFLSGIHILSATHYFRTWFFNFIILLICCKIVSLCVVIHTGIPKFIILISNRAIFCCNSGCRCASGSSIIIALKLMPDFSTKSTEKFRNNGRCNIQWKLFITALRLIFDHWQHIFFTDRFPFVIFFQYIRLSLNTFFAIFFY